MGNADREYTRLKARHKTLDREIRNATRSGRTPPDLLEKEAQRKGLFDQAVTLVEHAKKVIQDDRGVMRQHKQKIKKDVDTFDREHKKRQRRRGTQPEEDLD